MAPARGLPGMDISEYQVQAIEEAKNYLKSIEEKFSKKGFKVESRVRYGDIAEEILSHCVENDVDLIMLSTHGYSGVKRWIVGSVAQKIIYHATVPILLARSKEL